MTYFKKVSEYAICLLLAISPVFMLRHQGKFDEKLLLILTASFITTILSELSFALHVSIYGPFNLLGHFKELIAVYLIYTAVIHDPIL